MLYQIHKPGRTCGWLPSFEGSPVARISGHLLADVPVMPATVLGLELLLHERCVDLRMASQLVLGDVGATVQILRLIGSEYDRAEERPRRIEDCIASLDVEDWFYAVSAATLAGEHTAASAIWKHSRLIAQYARLVAESLEGVCPEEAYMVGLLHEVGAIPSVLGWQIGVSSAMDAGTLLAAEWCFPDFVVAALQNPETFHASPDWIGILVAAHQLANA